MSLTNLTNYCNNNYKYRSGSLFKKLRRYKWKDTKLTSFSIWVKQTLNTWECYCIAYLPFLLSFLPMKPNSVSNINFQSFLVIKTEYSIIYWQGERMCWIIKGLAEFCYGTVNFAYPIRWSKRGSRKGSRTKQCLLQRDRRIFHPRKS